ncbi:unnamed protein product [Oikopleura dioica]|uniref:Uncharacterized protein n=1 Tax=Oikopleura dioica TaxID=34765 RepID=E4XYV9_OIKDI|nr:unnamed protein product [Oikopleura dioica]CBY37822.1 unnamed protein product [Oikopleura dioica]
MLLKTLLGLMFVAETNQFGIVSDQDDVKIIIDSSVSGLSDGITRSKFIRHCGSKPCGIHNFNAITQVSVLQRSLLLIHIQISGSR